MSKKLSVRDKVTEYIDASVIADCIVDALKDAGKRVSFKNAKELWLAHLEELTSNLKGICKYRL